MGGEYGKGIVSVTPNLQGKGRHSRELRNGFAPNGSEVSGYHFYKLVRQYGLRNTALAH